MLLGGGSDRGSARVDGASAFLGSIGLGIYAPKLKERGYGDMAALEGISEREISQCIDKPGHARKLYVKLCERRGEELRITSGMVLYGWEDPRRSGAAATLTSSRPVWSRIRIIPLVVFVIGLVNLVVLSAYDISSMAAPVLVDEDDRSGVLYDGNEDVRSLTLANHRPLPDNLPEQEVLQVADPLRSYFLEMRIAPGPSYLRRDKSEHKRGLPEGPYPTSVDGMCYIDVGLFSQTNMLLFLQQPQEMALAAFYLCAKSKQRKIGLEWIPQDFSKWVAAWHTLRAEGGVNNAFCCYNPIDMQSYALTCPRQSLHRGQQNHWVESDVALAIAHMRRAWFVGVREAWVESLCVFYARANGTLPGFCGCGEDKDASVKPPELPDYAKDSALLPEIDLTHFPEETWHLLDQLTVKDQLLYNEAVKRLEREAQLIERKFGTKILCRELPLAKPLAERLTPRPEASRQAPQPIFTEADQKHFLIDVPKSSSSRKKCIDEFGADSPSD